MNSPCTGHCVLSKAPPRTCNGCGRSLNEIQHWWRMSEAEKREVIKRLEE